MVITEFFVKTMLSLGGGAALLYGSFMVVKYTVRALESKVVALDKRTTKLEGLEREQAIAMAEFRAATKAMNETSTTVKELRKEVNDLLLTIAKKGN